ncbi:MAG: hypothetical protein K0S12_392 [Bacteroidetes bacterium]|nr:hypothetical protein [Bacteroidota bacterium]
MKMISVARAIILMMFLFTIKNNVSAQTISPRFFGVNAWMPDTIGNVNNCIDPPCIRYGKLHKNWNKVKDSKAMSVRYGGIGPDKNMPTNYQYIRMIDSIRAKGMEPIIQVPFYNYRYSAQQAADIVQYVNVTKGKNIKYWIIGNEPNLSYSFTTASQIAVYFKQFASAMKSVDPTIMIVGPETAAFKQAITDGLTNPGGPYDITGKDANGRYYLDVFSFHTYPFGNSSTTLPTRAQLISKLTSSGSYQDDIIYLKNKLAAANAYHGRTGSAVLKMAITEANVVHTNHPTETLTGVGANSFIGGQFVAEMYGIGMKQGVDFINLWSVIEGGNSVEDNCGYIDPLTGNKKPVYYHFQMMADNFKGSSVNCTTNQTNVKAFASTNSQQTTVMILNEELNSAGMLIKKCVYSLSSHAMNNLPPSCTEYSSKDLRITAQTVSAPSVAAGAGLTISSTLQNAGTASSPASTIGYYLSTDTVYNSSDIFLTTASCASLASNGTLQKQSSIVIPAGTAAGNYYVVAYADPNNAIAESNEANNYKANALSVIVQNVTDAAISSPVSSTSSAMPGGTLTAGFTVHNLGNSTIPSLSTGYYLSTDTVWNSSDVLLTTQSFASLPAGGTGTGSKTVTIPGGTTSGSYYLLFVADNSSSLTEANENNNVKFKALSVNQNLDIAVSSPQLGSQTVVSGNTLTVGFTLINQGGSSIPAGSAGVYLSADNHWDSSDALLNNMSYSALSAGASVPKSGTCTIPASTIPGNYYILIYADNTELIAEVSESNNFAALSLQVNNPTTGIGDGAAANATQFNLFPNPTSGQITIELGGTDYEDKTILLEVYDMTGKEVYSRETFFTNNHGELTLPGELVQGFYLLCFNRGNKRQTHKIIITR